MEESDQKVHKSGKDMKGHISTPYSDTWRTNKVKIINNLCPMLRSRSKQKYANLSKTFINYEHKWDNPFMPVINEGFRKISIILFITYGSKIS